MSSPPPSSAPPAPAAGSPPPAPTRRAREPVARWHPWTAPLAVITALIAALIAGVAIGIVAGLAGVDVTDQPPGVLVAATLVQDLLFIGVALAFAARVGRPRPWQFGLSRPRFWRSVGWVLGAAILSYLFIFVYTQALGITSKEELPKQLGVGQGTAQLVLATLLVTVVAPIAEEFLFRGYIFTALRNWKGPWVSAVLTGIMFGAIHFSTPGDTPFLVPLAFFGFLLCLVRWRTGSLYPCIALHALNNAVAFGGYEHWRAWQVIALLVGDWLVIGLLTGPFARRGGGRPSGASAAPAASAST